jgi:NCS1 family nucleobase:cation symporter-1
MFALQGVATVTFANFVIVATLVLMAAPAVRHRLPFPVLACAAFRQHHLLIRRLGWFCIES